MSIFKKKPEPSREVRNLAARTIWFLYLFDPNGGSVKPKMPVPARTLFKVEGSYDIAYLVGGLDVAGQLQSFIVGNYIQRGVKPYLLIQAQDEIVFRLAVLDAMDRIRKNGLTVQPVPAWWAPSWRGP